MKLTIKDLNGAAVGEVDLGFAAVENGRGTQAVHDSVVAFRSNQRMGTASTKTMGEVAGTGKKPWRQKGTGRARAGSFASPLWRGGGVVFGPKPRDFGTRIPAATRKLALRKALSERAKAGDVTVVEELKLKGPSTKALISVLSALGAAGSVLLVTDAPDRNVILSARNNRRVRVLTGADLHAYDVLRDDHLILTRAALGQLGKRLA